MNTRLLSLVLIAATLAGCAAGGRKPKSGDKGRAGAAAGGAEAAPLPPGTDVEEANLKVDGAEFAADPELKVVRFDYDSAQLSEQALATLKDNAAALKRRKGAVALVAGHTDERGTVAYNLALGQRRAKEVRDYYIRLGVDGRRLATISYGKEQPVCAESDEDCWGRNRRAETRVRVSEAGGAAAAP